VKLFATAVSCILVLTLSPTASAITWNVPADAPTIQAGIDSASAGDTVLVACGTYYEHDLLMKSGITLRSETGLADCVTIDAETLGRVMFCNTLSSTTAIEGITFRDGLVTGEYPEDVGGGLRIHTCGFLHLRNCTFLENTADRGGGCFCVSSSPTFTDCVFEGNSATEALDTYGGGGMFCYAGSPSFSGCTFSSNTSVYHGGGLYFYVDCYPTMTDCYFISNSVTGAGGAGIHSRQSSSLTLTGCVFWNNSASGNGGGFQGHYDSNATLTNCSFYGNSSGGGGGGVSLHQSSTVSLTNTIIACSVVGEAIFCEGGGAATFTCCDVHGNAGGDWVGCIAGQDTIDGNFSEDPLFCDAEAGDFHVAGESPCAGQPGCGLIGAYNVGCGMSIASITDVGNDQGRQVRVQWTGAVHDAEGTEHDITHYSLWRRIRAERAYPPGDWDFVKSVPAYCEDSYSTVCETLCDSTIAEGMCWSVFFVRAGTGSPAVCFDSFPDSGYSVDNLEPQAPQGLTAEQAGEAIALNWDESSEDDFDFYAVYRGKESGFPPADPIGYSTTPTYTDSDLPGPGEYWYRITATDFSGNESDPSDEASAATTGAALETAIPTVFYLGPATPNPFNPVTEISYGIPAGAAPCRVVMDVFDATGRMVTTLVDTDQGAGTYHVTWDGRDHKGAGVASGVYFYRITWNGRAETRRMVLLK